MLVIKTELLRVDQWEKWPWLIGVKHPNCGLRKVTLIEISRREILNQRQCLILILVGLEESDL